jgi:hypothetical protein
MSDKKGICQLELLKIIMPHEEYGLATFVPFIVLVIIFPTKDINP